MVATGFWDVTSSMSAKEYVLQLMQRGTVKLSGSFEATLCAKAFEDFPTRFISCTKTSNNPQKF